MKNILKSLALVAIITLSGFTSFAQNSNGIAGINSSTISIEEYKDYYVPTLQSNAQNIVITFYINVPEYYDYYHTATVLSSSQMGAKLQADISNFKDNAEEYITKEFEITDTDAMLYWHMHELKRNKIIVLGLDEQANIVTILSYNKDYFNNHILN